MFSVASQTSFCSKPAFLVVSLFLHVPIGGTRFCLYAPICTNTYTSTHTHMQKCIIDLNTKHSIPRPSWTQLKTVGKTAEDCTALCVQGNKLRKLTIKLPAVRVQLVYKTFTQREGGGQEQREDKKGGGKGG